MSVGPLGGIAAGAAGSPLAQTKGSDIERTQQDTSSQQRQVQNNQKAETASGIGEADGEDHEAADRDADGRRPWETADGGEEASESADETPATNQRQSKDVSGDSGGQLDLTG